MLPDVSEATLRVKQEKAIALSTAPKKSANTSVSGGENFILT